MKFKGFTLVATWMIFSFTLQSQVLLWDNGGMVTHPGAGAAGFDVSMASTAPYTSVGSNVRNVPGQDHFRIADDFVLSSNAIITSIVTYAYETNNNSPAWSGFNMNIWDGRPGDAGSNIIASTTSASFNATNIYRVFNGAGNLSSTARLIQEITWDLNNLELSPGTYWIDWQVDGSNSIWANYVMEPNLVDINQPTTVTGNGRHLNNTGNWANLIDSAPEPPETPFQVYGFEPDPIPTLGEWGLMFLGMFLLLLVTITTKLNNTMSFDSLMSKLYANKHAFVRSFIVVSIAYLIVVFPLFVYFSVSSVWDIPMGLLFCLLITIWWKIAKIERENQPGLVVSNV